MSILNQRSNIVIAHCSLRIFSAVLVAGNADETLENIIPKIAEASKALIPKETGDEEKKIQQCIQKNVDAFSNKLREPGNFPKLMCRITRGLAEVHNTIEISHISHIQSNSIYFFHPDIRRRYTLQKIVICNIYTYLQFTIANSFPERISCCYYYYCCQLQ